MSIFFYGIGFILGTSYIQNLNEENYRFFKESFIEPYSQYKFLKKYRKENDLHKSPDELYAFINLSFKNTLYFFYYHLYDKHILFRFYKQQNNFDLIRNFEFMNETMQNIDVIKNNLQKRIIQENLKNEETEKLAENYKKDLNKSDDDNNMENILLMQNNSKDEFHKYQLSNNIFDKDEYEKSILPEIKLEKENTKIMLAKGISDARREFTEIRRMNYYDIYPTKKENIDVVNNLNKKYFDKLNKTNQKELDKLEVRKKLNEEGVEFNVLENMFLNRNKSS